MPSIRRAVVTNAGGLAQRCGRGPNSTRKEKQRAHDPLSRQLCERGAAAASRGDAVCPV